MKYILFTFSGEGIPIAQKLQEEGNDVLVAFIEDEKKVGVKEEKEDKERRLSMGDGIVKKENADKVLERLLNLPPAQRNEYFIICDFNHEYRYAEPLIEAGFIGLLPTKEDRELEEDRYKAKEYVKKHFPYLNIPETHEFKTIKEGIDFLKKENEIYVLKGNYIDASTIVPKSKDVDTAREELIEELEKNKKLYEREGFIFERKISGGIEMVPEGIWFNGVLLGVTVDIETKYIGAGNIGYQVGCAQDLVFFISLDHPIYEMFLKPHEELAKKRKGMFIGDAGVIWDMNKQKFYFLEYCFSSDTEVLTENGWKTYKEISIGERVLSWNTKTRELEWKPITRIIVKTHNGEMYKIKTIDALVTPDHKFWIDNGKKIKRVKVSELPKNSRWRIPRTGIWRGKDIPEIVLPEIEVVFSERIVKKGTFVKEKTDKVVTTPNGMRNYGIKTSKIKSFIHHKLPELRFKTKDLCWLLGLWLAEGNYGGYYKGEPRTLIIAQSFKNSKRFGIEKRLKKMGLKYGIAKNGSFVINNRRLAKYFWEELGLQNVYSDTKFIPKFFKELAPQYLYELLMGYMLGDGCYHKNQWVCSTVSKRLADDLQEIIHKIGWVADIKIQKTKGTLMTINGKTYQRKHDRYILSTKHQEVYTTCQKQNIDKEYYNGIVWDVSVADNESLMVRRNGKVFISSNCYQREGYNSVFTKLSLFDKVSEYYERIRNLIPLYNWQRNQPTHGASVRIFNLLTEENRRIAKGIKIKVGNPKFCWIWDAKKEENSLVNCGYDRGFAIVTGRGYDLYQAVEDCYENLRLNFYFPEMYYRPKFDYLSEDYEGSIVTRYNFVVNFDWERYKKEYDRRNSKNPTSS
jgi:hypothetical protein